MFIVVDVCLRFLGLTVFLISSVASLSGQVPRLEPSTLRLQRALRSCSTCFLESAQVGASLAWEVPRARSQMWSPDVGQLLQFYDEDSFRWLKHSFQHLASATPSRLDFGFDENVSRMLATQILQVANSGRAEYEECFRCIVLQSTVEQVLFRCPVS